MGLNDQTTDLADAQPDRTSAARWWHQMWQGSTSCFVDRLDQVQNQWELFEVVKFQYLATLFPNVRGTTSLECGCGSAGVSAFFAKRGYNTTMLDFAPSALALARRNFAANSLTGTFVLGDVGHLPFDSDTFDVVMSFGLVEHFVDVCPFFAEMVRTLKPGGLLFADIVPRRFNVQTLANASINLWAVFVYGLLTRGLRWTVHKAHSLFAPDYYENDFSFSSYKQFMEDAGLERVFITGNNPFPRLYLPGAFDRLYIRWLIKQLPLWKRFDQAQGWFVDQVWARAWWAHGYKSL
jgi:ubiquinone/menaquinone biosynthesis C-methylase UbiE